MNNIKKSIIIEEFLKNKIYTKFEEIFGIENIKEKKTDNKRNIRVEIDYCLEVYENIDFCFELSSNTISKDRNELLSRINRLNKIFYYYKYDYYYLICPTEDNKDFMIYDLTDQIKSESKYAGETIDQITLNKFIVGKDINQNLIKIRDEFIKSDIGQLYINNKKLINQIKKYDSKDKCKENNNFKNSLYLFIIISILTLMIIAYLVLDGLDVWKFNSYRFACMCIIIGLWLFPFITEIKIFDFINLKRGPIKAIDEKE